MTNKITDKYIISKPDRMSGITFWDIQNNILTPGQFKAFEEFMRGQTVGCLDDSCKVELVYVGDLERFMAINRISNELE